TYTGSTMVVIDGRTGMVSATLALATHPSAIAVNAKTNQIFIANQNAASVLVVDGASNTIAGTVKAGTIPYAMSVDTAANQVYVANFAGEGVTVIPTSATASGRWPPAPKFRVVALAERASGDHQSFVDTARVYLNKLAAENDFIVDYVNGTERINAEFLSRY